MGWMQALGAQLLHRLFMFFISPYPSTPVSYTAQTMCGWTEFCRKVPSARGLANQLKARRNL